MSKNKAIMVYTDGACSNNPGGPGGWAATLNYDERYDTLQQKGDVILVAGKGHENYQDVKGVKHHFDDKEELRNIMQI